MADNEVPAVLRKQRPAPKRARTVVPPVSDTGEIVTPVPQAHDPTLEAAAVAAAEFVEAETLAAAADAPAPTNPDGDITEAQPAPAIAEANNKGTRIMATNFEQTTTTATDRIQAMFGDANGRAKQAMERSTKLAEDVAELTKGNMEAIVASGRVAAKAAESLTQDAAEFGRKNFEAATSTMKNMASVKSPTELFQIQSDYARSSFDAMVAEVSKFSENYMKLVGEVVQPLSSRYAVAVDKFKGASL